MTPHKAFFLASRPPAPTPPPPEPSVLAAALQLCHPQAAGIDSGAAEPGGAVPPGRAPWGVVTFEKMTKPEAVSTLVLTNTPQ